MGAVFAPGGVEGDDPCDETAISFWVADIRVEHGAIHADNVARAHVLGLGKDQH